MALCRAFREMTLPDFPFVTHGRLASALCAALEFVFVTCVTQDVIDSKALAFDLYSSAPFAPGGDGY